MSEPSCRLYLITPNDLSGEDKLQAFAEQLDAALSGGDVACLQIRLKEASDAEVVRAAEVLIPIAHRAGVAVLINDRPDLAKDCGADGVHVGQEDATYDEARGILGPQASIGVTCHDSRHLAMEAGEAGADYVAFGAFYKTSTKEAKTQADKDVLEWWSSLFEVPCVAIGGITPENCAPLVTAGADFLAVSSGVWGYPAGPKAAVEAFNKVILEHSS